MAYWVLGAAVSVMGAIVAKTIADQFPLAERVPFWIGGTAIIFQRHDHDAPFLPQLRLQCRVEADRLQANAKEGTRDVAMRQQRFDEALHRRRWHDHACTTQQRRGSDACNGAACFARYGQRTAGDNRIYEQNTL